MTLTAEEQYMIELINRARLDPLAEATILGIDLNEGLPEGTIDDSQKQPLAPNQYLEAAADSHSSWMLANNTFSHTGANGSSPGDRMAAAGYQFTGSWTWGENLSWRGTTGTLDLESAIEQQHYDLFLSPGHRTNLLNGTFREVGVAQVEGEFTSGGTTYNASMVTQKFAKSGSDIFITGVAYNDLDLDAFYTPGEGISGATYSVGGATTTTATAGGYSLGISPAADATVTVSYGAFSGTVLVDLSLGNVKLDLVDGNKLLVSSDLTIISGVNHVTLLGSADTNLTGNADNNTLAGNRSNNILTGNAGMDFLYGQAGDDTLYGGDHTDALFGGDGMDNMQGGNGDDGLDGGAGDDYMDGGAGVDWLYGKDGNDTMLGGGEGDALFGEDGNDRLDGGDGADGIDGGYGDDTMEGGAGVDWLYGGFGNDVMHGASFAFDSNDTDALFGQEGADLLYGGGGGDNLDGGADNDTLRGGNGDDWLYGQDGDDAMYGDAGSDVLFGGDGNDLLEGGADGDSLDGGLGNDTLEGGDGTDILWGGEGADQFLYWSPTEGEDLIRDFVSGEDSIQIYGLDFGFALTGTIVGAGVWSEGSGLPADLGNAGSPMFYYETTYKTLWFDETGGDTADAVAIVSLETGNLAESDIYLM